MHFDSQLEQLHKKFATDLPERLLEIQRLYQAQLNTGSQPAALRQALHRLTGLAGTFKAHRISELSRNLEMHYAQSLDDTPQETQRIIAILFQRLEQAVNYYITQPTNIHDAKAKCLPLTQL